MEERMKRVLIVALALLGVTAAYAQDPAPKPDANAEHPPTNRMDEATPTMKAPAGEAEHAPTNRVDQAVPPMKPTDPQTADTGTKTGTAVPNEQWVNRAVYSSDGKNVGEVASVSGSDVYVDIGGLLGLGETRALIKSDQIQDVQDDRIVIKLTEAEAKNLPAVKEPAEAPKQ